MRLLSLCIIVVMEGEGRLLECMDAALDCMEDTPCCRFANFTAIADIIYRVLLSFNVMVANSSGSR